jgi:inosine-uridine nucleoside N-ribohydrolase
VLLSRSGLLARRAALAVVLGSAVLRPGTAGAETQKVILDTDGDGDYDDLVAVMLAAVSPELDLLGVVATGSDAGRRARTVAKALQIQGRPEVGVYLGDRPGPSPPSFDYASQFPVRRWELFPRLTEWAADSPAKPSSLPGAEFVAQAARRYPGEITVIATGPLSSLARALSRSDGAAVAPLLKQVYFSGGDFETAEYNVYEDTAAASAVFRSGVPVFQFGGESDKVYLAYQARQRLWSARTPATWALQDYYRLYRAGWDPRAPFVPILYDARPIVALVEGEAVSRCTPMALDVDASGRLIEVGGPRDVHRCSCSPPDRILAFVVARLTDGTRPATHHLRALRGLCASRDPGLEARLGPILDRLQDDAVDPAAIARRLAELRPRLASLGEDRLDAEWHLDMARDFLLGRRREHPWRDPYTAAHVRAFLVLHRLPRRMLAFLAGVLVLAVAGWAALAWRRRSRRVASVR